MRPKTTMVLPYLLLVMFAWPHNAAAQPQPAPAQAAAWSRYTYPGEEFSVELPAMPAVFHTTRVISYAPKYDSDKVRVFGLYSGGVVYMVVSFDRPRPAESDDRLAGYVWDGRGVTPRGEAKLGELVGSEYEVGLGFKGAARVFRTEKRAYLLKAFSDAEGFRPEVERFLNSFEPGAPPRGEAVADYRPVPPDTPPKATPTPRPETGGTGPGRGGNTGGPAAPGVGEETLRLARGRGGANAGEGPFKQSEVERKAVIVYKPEPGFTEEARKNNVTGVVRLRAVLSPSGKVTNVSVVKGLPRGLTDNAVRAARHILFFPPIKDGREVPQYVVLEYHFNIYY